MKRIFLTLATALFAFSISTMAQTATPVATKRQMNQQVRIAEGRADEKLSGRETKKLKAEQRHIRRVKRRSKADGVVTADERTKIARKQNRAGRHIRREKHD